MKNFKNKFNSRFLELQTKIIQILVKKNPERYE